MKRTMNLWVLLAVIAVLTAGFLFSYRSLTADNAELDGELYREKTELSAQQKQQNELKATQQKVNTDAYIENLARMKYDYISKDEIRLVIENPEVLYEDGIVPDRRK